jgi:hypothetical protein
VEKGESRWQVKAVGGFVAVLEIPPVDSPETAVKMAIYSDIKKGKINPSK